MPIFPPCKVWAVWRQKCKVLCVTKLQTYDIKSLVYINNFLTPYFIPHGVHAVERMEKVRNMSSTFVLKVKFVEFGLEKLLYHLENWKPLFSCST